MHLPLVRLLAAPAPEARLYHALCTGYAGVLAGVWSQRTGRPLLLTEHGIYVRERVLELNRAAWSRARSRGAGPARGSRKIDAATAAILRRMWTRFFRVLAQCAYARASRIVSISETNRTKQILDGAPPEKTHVVPNGIDVDALRARLRAAQSEHPRRRVCVGFVGRLVPIKDVVTFIQACSLALRVVDLDVRIIGPIGEDRDYARRCQHLAAGLGLLGAVRFEGPRRLEEIYPELDMLVLTSFSEGQPLVILEAGAAGIPVISSDVGCCRELLEGASGRDRELGPSGIVTRIASSEETAAAIILLARDASLRQRLGEAGHRRVAAFYRQRDTISAYQALYGDPPWPASAGASST
jgi:glycosyltransferase involved in cell wall biosynthesis